MSSSPTRCRTGRRSSTGCASGRAGRDGRARRIDRQRQVDRRPPAPASTTSTAASWHRRPRRPDAVTADLRTTVNVVTDDPFLFATSVFDNVAFARPDAAPHLVDAALADAAAAGFVAELLGVDTEIGERGLTLSGGQRQRLALARALLADPTVLVLDDATSAIDVAIEEQIHEAIRRRRARRTTILIAHRLSTIALADRVLFIDGGRVVAAGTHQQLLATDPRYGAILADTKGLA
ncbi:MAG: ABC transporter ATP-binding protein [Acidimicrobiales bacterium]